MLDQPRLSGLDDGFLALERDFQPMGVGVLAVLSADAAPLSLEWLRRHVEDRLPVLPALRRRLVPVPGGLGRPVLVETEPDLAAHVSRIVLADPDGAGEDRRLEDLVARLSAEHLPQDRPMWRLLLVDGLSGGRQGLLLQVHHALADGSAILTIARRLFSDEPVEPVTAGADRHPGPPLPAAVPGRLRLLLTALLLQLVALGGLPALLARTWRGVARVRHRTRVSEVRLPEPREGSPRTVLNEAFSPGRTFLTTSLPLDGLRQVGAATATTLNDVVLAVVAGAVRRLLGPGEVPGRPLLAQVPVSDPASETGTHACGNAFWSLTTSLATEVADPLERLQRISAVTAEAKARLAAFGVGLVADWLDVVPPRLLRRGVAGVLTRLRTAEHTVDTTVTVSNLRGPSGRYALGGRTVSGLFIAGPPSNGVGLNVCVMSYAGGLDLGVLAYADALPAPEVLRTALEESWAELAAAVGTRTGASSGVARAV